MEGGLSSTLRRVEYVLQSVALGSQSDGDEEEIKRHAWEILAAIYDIVNGIIWPLIETLSKGFDAERRDDVKHHIGLALSQYLPGLPDAKVGILAEMDGLALLAPRLNELVQADTMYMDDKDKRSKLIQYYRRLVANALSISINCTRRIDFSDYVNALFK